MCLKPMGKASEIAAIFHQCLSVKVITFYQVIYKTLDTCISTRGNNDCSCHIVTSIFWANHSGHQVYFLDIAMSTNRN